jgi:hypothetical protein
MRGRLLLIHLEKRKCSGMMTKYLEGGGRENMENQKTKTNILEVSR